MGGLRVAAGKEATAESQAPERRRDREPVRTIELIVRKPHWEDFWHGMRSVVMVLEAMFFGLAVAFAIAVYWFR